MTAQALVYHEYCFHIYVPRLIRFDGKVCCHLVNDMIYQYNVLLKQARSDLTVHSGILNHLTITEFVWP